MSNEVLPFTVRIATSEDFWDISNINKQVQQLHIEGRPDIYSDTSASLDHNAYENGLLIQL
ncbi:hypothetical protein IIO_04943 [Bacillus cereus VD115]|nr:hypothetical protein IIO_04943 [Bacillus cereus VD115]